MPGKRAVKKQSISEIIANDLRERILNGQLAEGEAVRQEILAQEYDVSRMPVREALKQLSTEGLIHWENNKGGTVIKHSLSEIAEIFDLRTLIEVDLFQRAIPRMTSADYRSCASILERMETSYHQQDEAHWGQLNHAFHTALYTAAERRLTDDVLTQISVMSDRYVRMHLGSVERRARAQEDHGNLLHLAEERDIPAAKALLASHIQQTKADLLEMLSPEKDRQSF